MRFIYNDYNLIANITENSVTVIIGENPYTFLGIVQNINCLLENKESKILITDDSGEKIDINKCEIVLSPIDFELNSKKVLSKIYKEFDEISKNELWMEKSNINSQTESFICSISEKLPYVIEYETDIKTEELLKLYKVRLQENYETLLEKLCNYVTILSQICYTNCLFLVNIRDYFSKEQLNLLYETVFYNKVQLVLIESHQREKLQNEHVYLIDDSNCIIEF